MMHKSTRLERLYYSHVEKLKDEYEQGLTKMWCGHKFPQKKDT